MMRLYNTLTRSEENFAPGADNTVRMYTCGLTVYARGHIGNFRTFICVDVLRRTLKYLLGYQVRQVMNFTDVDDRTIVGAQKAGMDLRAYTDQYIADVSRGRARARPRGGRGDAAGDRRGEPAGDGRSDRALDKNGHTYVSDGSIYFKISTLPDVRAAGASRSRGHEAGRARRLRQLREGRRARLRAVEGHQAGRADVGLSSIRPAGPGWHLECSAMALRLLGESADRHSRRRHRSDLSRITRTRSRRAKARPASRSRASGCTSSI